MDHSYNHYNQAGPGVASSSVTPPESDIVSQRLQSRFENQQKALEAATHSTAEEEYIICHWKHLMESFHVARCAANSIAEPMLQATHWDSNLSTAEINRPEEIEALDRSGRRAIHKLSKAVSRESRAASGSSKSGRNGFWNFHRANSADIRADILQMVSNLKSDLNRYISKIEARETRLLKEQKQRERNGRRRRDQLIEQSMQTTSCPEASQVTRPTENEAVAEHSEPSHTPTLPGEQTSAGIGGQSSAPVAEEGAQLPFWSKPRPSSPTEMPLGPGYFF